MNHESKKNTVPLIKRFLSIPSTGAADVDDPNVTFQRREIIRSKRFLNTIYREWYAMQIARIPDLPGAIVEIGSGAGFMDELLPGLITSEVFFCPFVDLIMNAMQMPLPAASTRAIVMTDVFHHIPDVERFLCEAERILKPGGRIIMIEPWVTGWSRWVMDHFHSEPMDVNAKEWQFPSKGPLSSSNQALPWIVFDRDRDLFLERHPRLKMSSIQPFMPFRYLLSGGVSMRALAPACCNGLLQRIESRLERDRWAMFVFLVLEKDQA